MLCLNLLADTVGTSTVHITIRGGPPAGRTTLPPAALTAKPSPVGTGLEGKQGSRAYHAPAPKGCTAPGGRYVGASDYPVLKAQYSIGGKTRIPSISSPIRSAAGPAGEEVCAPRRQSPRAVRAGLCRVTVGPKRADGVCRGRRAQLQRSPSSSSSSPH